MILRIHSIKMTQNPKEMPIFAVKLRKQKEIQQKKSFLNYD